MQKESKSAVYFAGGLTAGVGAALIVNCVSSYALAVVALIVTLMSGIFLGRSSRDAVEQPADDEEDDWTMIPEKKNAEEENDENADR